MRSSIFISIFLHAIIFTLGVYGLPMIKKTSFEQEIPMVVEIIPMGLSTNITSVRKKSERPKKKKLESQKNLPIVKKEKVRVKLSRSKKEREVVPELAVPKPEPKPKPKVKLIKKPKPNLKVQEKLAKVRPRRKPKPPDPFAMVLKNLEKDFQKPVSKKEKLLTKKPKAETDLIERLSKSLSRQRAEFDPDKQITMSERHAMINAVKRRMEPCWNFQAGSKKAQDIIVEIEVKLRPDGYVSDAKITNRSGLKSDPFKLAAGESALRAVLNPSCQPYILPANRYDVWKDIKLTFNPREMLGR